MCVTYYITPKKECQTCPFRNEAPYTDGGGKYWWNCSHPSRPDTAVIKLLTPPGMNKLCPDTSMYKPCPLLKKSLNTSTHESAQDS